MCVSEWGVVVWWLERAKGEAGCGVELSSRAPSSWVASLRVEKGRGTFLAVTSPRRAKCGRVVGCWPSPSERA